LISRGTDGFFTLVEPYHKQLSSAAISAIH
jgi:hypothetical protein